MPAPPTHAAMLRVRGRAWETLWEGTEADCFDALLPDDYPAPVELALVRIGADPATDYLYKEKRLARGRAMPRAISPSIRPPVKWFGGKAPLTPWIISLIPAAWKRRHRRGEEHIYAEPFAGMASVFLNKPPCDVEIFNDLDCRIWNLFNVLKNDGEEFCRQLALTPYHEGGFERCRAAPEGEGVAAAVAFYVRQRQAFGGQGRSFSYTKFRSRTGMADVVSGWLSSIESNLPRVISRLQEVQYLRRSDAVTIIREFDSPRTLFYCDPPYLTATRAHGGVYKYEMTDADHRRLLDAIQQCKGKVMLSGYPSPMYDAALGGWRCETKEAANHAAKSKSKRRMTECLWCNFDPEMEVAA